MRDHTITPGLATPDNVLPPSRKIHLGLAIALGAGIAAHVMRGRRGAGDLEHPDEAVFGPGPVDIAPAQIVQRVLRRLAEGAVHLVGQQAVNAGAFVDLVEMGDRLARTDRVSRRRF